jgi:hypothetical protein
MAEMERGRGGKKRLQAIKDARPKPIKVRAANDTVKRLVKHPHGGGFKSDGTAMWPQDNFTTRRLKDGDITLEAPAAAPAHPSTSHAASHKPQ